MQSGDIRLKNGLRVHYVETGDPQGQPVLFLHGWPDSWFSYSRVLALLPSTIRAVAFDLRGFGDSDRPESGYAIDDLADDAIAFLDALSVARATVVGHSLGTFIARCMAIRHPERVARLVLIGSGFSPDTPVLREAQAAVADLADPLSPDFVREFQSGTAYRPVPDQFMDGIIQESLKAPARVWRDAMDHLLRYEDSGKLSSIQAPALLMWGDHDAVFESRQEQEELASRIPATTLRVYAETGHCPNWERPEEVAADLGRFVLGGRDAPSEEEAASKF